MVTPAAIWDNSPHLSDLPGWKFVSSCENFPSWIFSKKLLCRCRPHVMWFLPACVSAVFDTRTTSQISPMFTSVSATLGKRAWRVARRKFLGAWPWPRAHHSRLRFHLLVPEIRRTARSLNNIARSKKAGSGKGVGLAINWHSLTDTRSALITKRQCYLSLHTQKWK